MWTYSFSLWWYLQNPSSPCFEKPIIHFSTLQHIYSKNIFVGTFSDLHAFLYHINTCIPELSIHFLLAFSFLREKILRDFFSKNKFLESPSNSCSFYTEFYTLWATIWWLDKDIQFLAEFPKVSLFVQCSLVGFKIFSDPKSFSDEDWVR